jgi:hypothetical protein
VISLCISLLYLRSHFVSKIIRIIIANKSRLYLYIADEFHSYTKESSLLVMIEGWIKVDMGIEKSQKDPRSWRHTRTTNISLTRMVGICFAPN